MANQEYARRVELSVTIDGHEVASHFAPYLLELSYTDNASGKADDLQLALHDRDGLFTGDWMPKKGMSIEASVICHDWEASGEDLQLPCGSFKIDELEFSGPPDKISIKAVSADLTGPLRDTKKTRAWENMSLEGVAGQIARENGLQLYYSGPAHQFERQDQRNEGDIAFLNRLCADRSMHCKAHNGWLACFDADEAEAAGAMVDIPKKEGLYSPTSYSFKMSSADTDFSDAEVAYSDPKTGTTHKAKVRNKKAGEKSKTMTVQKRAESPEAAATLGKAELRKANAKERSANLEIMGCPVVASGQMVALAGFGAFDGKWFVKTATHKVFGSGGYTTALELSAPAGSETESAHDEISEAGVKARQEIAR